VWYAAARKAITVPQGCIIVALYGSSPIFLNYFSELRAYFLMYSAGIALAIASLTIVRSGEKDGMPARSDLVLYGLCLAAFINLHYFAGIMGGLLTLAILADLAVRRERRVAVAVMLAGIAAAIPVVVLGVTQLTGVLQPGSGGWIKVSPLSG